MSPRPVLRKLKRWRILLGELGELLRSADNEFREIFGLTRTITISVDVLGLASGMALMGAQVVRAWQSDRPPVPGFDPVAVFRQFPMRCLYTLGAVAAWVLVLAAMLRYIRKPLWWALPYVLWILCPAAWLLGEWTRRGVDYLVLFSLQLPIAVACIRGTARKERARDRGAG